MSDYTQDWLRYKRLRNQLLLVCFGLSPILFVLMVIISISGGPSWAASLASGMLNVCWLALLVFMYFRVRNWPCPRCGRRFYSYSERHGLWLFTRHCGYCDLPKYLNDPSTAA